MVVAELEPVVDQQAAVGVETATELGAVAVMVDMHAVAVDMSVADMAVAVVPDTATPDTFDAVVVMLEKVASGMFVTAVVHEPVAADMLSAGLVVAVAGRFRTLHRTPHYNHSACRSLRNISFILQLQSL